MVQPEFIDVVLRRDAVEARYVGGWQQFVADHDGLIGGSIWFDERLVRTGAMSATDAKGLVEFYIAKGLNAFRKRNGRAAEWVDLCVSQSFGSIGSPTLPCRWIAYDPETGGIFMKGHEPGTMSGREISIQY